MSAIQMRPVDVCDIYELRRDILRAGAPIESVHFAGDDDNMTQHLAIFADEKLIGCITLTAANSDYFEEEKQYQLRGMAIDEPYQRQGYGTALLRYAEYMALSRGISRVWCNARVHAVDFYAKEGYCCYGEKFFIPQVCDHILMGKVVEYHSCCGSCASSSNNGCGSSSNNTCSARNCGDCSEKTSAKQECCLDCAQCKARKE